MFRFRRLVADDFPLLLEWLSKEHVKQWWDDGDDTLEKVARNYGEEEALLERFILVGSYESGEKPIGYFQYYLVPEGSIGIDQFIGEEEYINRGVGTKAIQMFVEMIRRERKPTSIILDPSPENKRAIRCYEKAGFKHYETRAGIEGPAYMMRLADSSPAS
ncbi:MAG TPA: GNAT family N-acetyltransferase [Pyrinomonadaceae bacterium]|nr:GNAT family N-acetyltransferase [Pyrinomonadaceae bacterium]